MKEMIHPCVRVQFNLGLTIIALLWSCEATFSQDAANIVIGERTNLYSNILNKEIQLSIHLPESDENSLDRYPVLCVFQTHFAQVSGAIKNLYDYDLIPKLMVISIDNYEYGWLTPTKIDSDPNSGQADRFLQFFKEELFPYVDSAYRTQPYRIVFSNSWGAMLGAYAILARPDVFNAAIASIPWVAYDGENRFMINNTKRFLKNGDHNSHFLYMTMDNETDILPDLEAFISILHENPKPDLTWEYHQWPEEDHQSTPYRTIYSGLRSLFRVRNEVPDSTIEKGLEALKEYELDMNAQFGYSIGLSRGALWSAGRKLLDQDRHEEGYAVLKYNIEIHPDDPFNLIELGRAYEANNQLRLAKEFFEKAYQLAKETSARQIKWVKSHLDRINERIESEGDDD